MRSTRRWLWLAALAALAAALVLSAPTGAGTTPAHAVVKTAFNKKLKKRIVVDGNGRTLYMFTADTGGTPTCTPTGVGAQCYSGESKPGDVRGQKILGAWYVLTPKGNPIKK